MAVEQRAVGRPSARSGAPANKAMKWLLDAFDGGGYAPGDRLPSEREMCELAQVSRTMLRPVLAQLEAAGVVSLVGRKRFYLGEDRVPRLESPWGQTVVLYTFSPALRPETDAEYLPNLIDTHAMAGLREHGYDALFVSGLERLQETLATLESTPPAGVVCGELTPAVDEKHRTIVDDLQPLRARGVPVLVVGNEPELRDFDRVTSDQCNGVFKLMSWLASKGCRRVLPFWYVPAPTDWIQMRDSGYRLAASELGLDPLPNPFQVLDELPPDLTDRGPVDVYARLLNPFVTGPDAADAVMLTEDRQLTTAAAACRQLGRRPGEDILLAGYDNTWRAFHVSDADAPAATIDKDYRAEGRELANLLHERLTGQLPETPQIRWIPPQLVVPRKENGR